MSQVCKNHPDKEAKRKCHYCKALICTDCQLKLANHIYCSKSCYYLEIVEKVTTAIRSRFQRFLLVFKNKSVFNRRNVFDAFLVLGIISSIWIAWKSYQFANQPRVIIPENPPSTRMPAINQFAKHLDTLKVLTPLPSEMVLRNKFEIEGEAENNRIVSLSSNGSLLDVQIVKGKRFAFPNVIAKPGQNHFIVRSMREDGSSTILEEISFYFGQPTIRYLAQDFVRGGRTQKKIALTFDGGYLDNTTDEILDILKQEHIKATIFLTGIYMRKYPDTVKRMAEEGHVIGNHTWTHPHLTTYAQNGKHDLLGNITRETIHQELLRTAELYHMITERQMSNLWRAPYGEHNPQIREWAAEAGFRHVGWTVGKNWDQGMDTMDWVADKNSTAYHTADEIAEKILSFGADKKDQANGVVILMHLGSEREDDYPHLKLPYIIDELKNRGYDFVTVPEMF